MLINIATEDELSQAVAERLIEDVFGAGKIGNRLGCKGNGYLIARLPNFRQMAKREPVLLLTDLDDLNCAPTLLEKWTSGQPFPKNLLLRVAVRETEAWLLADRQGFAEFLGISPQKIPPDPENLRDPKQFLLNIAHSAKREVRSELIAPKGAIAKHALGYNRALSAFVATKWSVDSAAAASSSLSKALSRIRELAIRVR